jgi:tetratricopeptide (TPR) repeat protein
MIVACHCIITKWGESYEMQIPNDYLFLIRNCRERVFEMIDKLGEPIPVIQEETPMVKENKVCVYAICKNEVQFVDKWIESMKEADLIVVLDTGSTDGTVERLLEHSKREDVNLIVDVKEFKPWRFDTPRNAAMEMIPEPYNILISTDLDELLEPGWADILRERWIEGVHERGNYKYSWSHLSNGESGRVFVYDKIHSRNWVWKYPVHELLWNTKTKTNHYSTDNTLYLFDEIHLHHYPDHSKSRSSYLPLLELRAEENEDDYYGLIYLAHEYYYQGQYENSIKTLNRVLEKHRGEYTTLEEASCYLFMGDSYFALKDNKKAKDSYLKAIDIDPSYREPYLDLVKVFLDDKKYELAKHFISECLERTYRHYTWLERDTSWTHEPYDLMSLALYYSGDKKGSLSYAIKAYSYDPTDNRLRDNVNVILETISDREWADIK